MMMYNYLSSDNCTSTFINPPITYSSSQGFPHKTFPSNDTCFSLFHPPSPLFMSYEDESLLFPYLRNHENQQPPFSIEDFNVPVCNQEMMGGGDSSKIIKNDGNGNTMSNPKNKCSRKDRHSKIITSRGLRDRRMRLSLEVAPRFFNLQEMLGFDKASQTLEWLMNKSQWAIKELSINTTSCADANRRVPLLPSSTCECDEVISSSTNVVEDSPPEGVGNLKGEKKSSPCTKKLKKNEKTSRPIGPFSKRKREEARERARERTLNKKQVVNYNAEARGKDLKSLSFT